MQNSSWNTSMVFRQNFRKPKLCALCIDSKQLEAIKNKEIGMDPSFGDDWEQYWKLAMRMAASFSFSC